MNTCKSVSKQTTLTAFRMNTYAKTGGRGPRTSNSNLQPSASDLPYTRLPEAPFAKGLLAMIKSASERTHKMPRLIRLAALTSTLLLTFTPFFAASAQERTQEKET